MKYQNTTPPVQTASQPAYSERQFLHTYQAGVGLPLAQAFVTALLIGLIVFVVAILVFDALDPFTPAGIAGIGVLVAGWLFAQRRWLTLTEIEKALNRDLNNDKVIGEPKTVRVQVTEIKDNGHIHIDSIFDLPYPDKLPTFAQGVLNGLPITEKEWSPLKDGKLFSLGQIRNLLTVMKIKKLLTVTKQGHQLTRSGKAVMKQLAASPSPTPSENDDEE